MTEYNQKFMQEAIDMAKKGMQNNEGGPFGAVIVKNGEIIGKGNNKVTSTNDPTAHAEVTAIRAACKKLGSFQLNNCELYTSCEPCPMCLGAIYWARPSVIYYACTKKDAADINFDDDFIYKEIATPIPERTIKTVQVMRDEGLQAFRIWQEKSDRVDY
jgi:tRNA(Arg) A34 adenosine deaminase TadA